MKLMLTSCGLETPNIMEKFLSLLPCAPQEAKVLFLPAAAISCDAIEVLPKCLEDLYKADIPKENITIYDLHVPLTKAALSETDCIYIPGGNTIHLAKRLREGSSQVLLQYLHANRGVIVGVSAGSMVFSTHTPAALDILPNELHVHCSNGTQDGKLPPAHQPIFLSNVQAIVYEGNREPKILSN